jgi:hypothetical protein
MERDSKAWIGDQHSALGAARLHPTGRKSRRLRHGDVPPRHAEDCHRHDADQSLRDSSGISAAAQEYGIDFYDCENLSSQQCLLFGNVFGRKKLIDTDPNPPLQSPSDPNPPSLCTQEAIGGSMEFIPTTAPIRRPANADFQAPQPARHPHMQCQ